MKMKNLLFAVVAVSIFALSACNNSNGGSTEVKTESDSTSYALGYSIGKNIVKQFPDINPAIIGAAISDVYAEKEITMFADEQAAGMYIQAYLGKEMEIKGQDNLEAGNKFLEENRAKEGITTTESGLQYEVLTEGDGAKPTTEDRVRVHYHGTLLDGTIFDSSVDSGNPATFGVTEVIKGWTEVLQLMPVGSKWKVFVPSELAYGANPRAGGVIEPNMVLVFEVELLEIIAQE